MFREIRNAWRRERDSNTRYAINVYTLSRRAPSTTQPPLRNFGENKLDSSNMQSEES